MSGIPAVLWDLPRFPGGHQALPVSGSYRSEATGQSAVLTDASWCYPLIEECRTSGPGEG